MLVGEARWPRCARARGWGRARCAAARSCWPRGRTSRSCELRGNVDTRLAKRRRARSTCWCWPRPAWTGCSDAARRARCCTSGLFVPAAGQGVIAIQARAGSPAASAALRADHARTHARAGRRARRRPRARGHLPHAGRACCAAGRRACAGSSACRTARSGSSRRRAAGARSWPAAARAARGRARAAAGADAVTVYLVGAGPGDPGLLTVRARELIDAADVILYDRLIPPGALDGARADAELRLRRQAGRRAADAAGGDRPAAGPVRRPAGDVVRLKGGDPFVFGRGGEEALVLREAGIPFEVVPGITAGIAAPAYAGVPVTHRELASGVAFVTGHENPDKPETALDWPALAAFPGTLVFYMGVKALPRIAEQLIAGGRPRGRAGRGRRARDAAGPEDGRSRRWARSGVARGHPRAGDHARRRRSPALRERDRVAGDAAAARAHGRGHARAGAGERAGGAAARAGRRRSSRRRRSARRRSTSSCRTWAATTSCA